MIARTTVTATSRAIELAVNRKRAQRLMRILGIHLGFGPGPIRPDGTRGYLDPAPLPPPVKPACKTVMSAGSFLWASIGGR